MGSEFRVEIEECSDGLAAVVLEGEVDIYTAPEFKRTLERAIEGGASRLMIDLERVSFMDSTALGVLVGGVKQLRERDGALAVVCRDENVARIFQVTGLDHIFAVCATREETLRALAERTST
jgi:anti-sigma B factor antagonist